MDIKDDSFTSFMPEQLLNNLLKILTALEKDVQCSFSPFWEWGQGPFSWEKGMQNLRIGKNCALY